MSRVVFVELPQTSEINSHLSGMYAEASPLKQNWELIYCTKNGVGNGALTDAIFNNLCKKNVLVANLLCHQVM